MQQIRKLILLTHPLLLTLSLLSYGLGLGLARYLGATLVVESQYLGGVIIILIQAASTLLAEYFLRSTPSSTSGETRSEWEEFRSLTLIVSLCFIAASLILTYLLEKSGSLSIEGFIFLILFILMSLSNAVPPLKIIDRGFGELTTAVLISSFSATLGFLMQFGILHRLLTLFTLPLLLLGLAYLLILNFPTYASDLKSGRKSLLINLTWQRAIPIHNIFLCLAYLFLALIPFLGVSFNLVWPALLTIPLAAYQIYLLNNLSKGMKPVWSILITNATAIFGLTTYLIAITFWIH